MNLIGGRMKTHGSMGERGLGITDARIGGSKLVRDFQIIFVLVRLEMFKICLVRGLGPSGFGPWIPIGDEACGV